ncbi:MAG TPA: alcohol dehydrogenase catalytic domain-containing protein [Egibacteraceae bacterium]|jgi:erythritol/L-threitol dehydrogenase|nr:alcohol dehydrogenase catalytic domain-containing protein [Egibacteraceae bacterium]
MSGSLTADRPERMRAVVCYAPGDYRLEERPVPAPGEVLTRVEAVGICASDLKCYQGAPLFRGDEHRDGCRQPPVIPGHEFVGRVVALGEGAGERDGLRVGNPAVSEQIVPCWTCRYCRREPVTVDWTIVGDTNELDVHGAHWAPTATPSPST